MSEITLEELRGRLGEVTLVDVRTSGEYDGTNGHSCDPRQGHIPGARNVEIGRLITLDAEAIEAEMGTPPGGEVVAYCHSGSRSAVAVQVLRSLGWNARNYPGSWHEWSRHDDLPVEARARSRGPRST